MPSGSGSTVDQGGEDRGEFAGVTISAPDLGPEIYSDEKHGYKRDRPIALRAQSRASVDPAKLTPLSEEERRNPTLEMQAARAQEVADRAAAAELRAPGAEKREEGQVSFLTVPSASAHPRSYPQQSAQNAVTTTNAKHKPAVQRR